MSTSSCKAVGFDLVPDNCSGVVLGIGGGAVLRDGKWKAVAPQKVTLEGETNYVEVDADGYLSANVSAFTSGSDFLYKATTSGGLVTAIEDWRHNPTVDDSVTTNELTTLANALRTYLSTDGVLTAPTLAVTADATKFKITNAFSLMYSGGIFTKAAADNLTFTAAHVVVASKYGIVLVQMTPAGVVSTKVPGASQSYNTAALALAAKPAVDAGNVEIGYLAIANNTGDWTANTDDLTDGSDLTTAAFTTTLKALPAAVA